ncbi:hypothetical protein car1b_004 [Escherichia phage Carena]|nr:hypothetical protein car1b_004 [Escherichia phage Carena]
MATTNSRTSTLWTINGRSPDSRDVYDRNNIGLRVGRIDIPASVMFQPSDIDVAVSKTDTIKALEKRIADLEKSAK